MISRLMLSLKKASKVEENGWTSNALSGAQFRVTTRLVFAEPPSIGPGDTTGTTLDEVAPSDLDCNQRKERTGGDNA